jgi:hypothetical protein
MISNIGTSRQKVCATTNDGTQPSTLIGDFKSLGVVWYNPEAIANILSLAILRKVYRVTMDTSVNSTYQNPHMRTRMAS